MLALFAIASSAGGFSREFTVQASEKPQAQDIYEYVWANPWFNYPAPSRSSYVAPKIVSSGIQQWPIPSKEDAQTLVKFWANYYGIDQNLALIIVQCESGFYSMADNSVSTAFGLYQFLDNSWITVQKELGETLNRYDENAQAKAGAFWLSTRGTNPWLASKSCWGK